MNVATQIAIALLGCWEPASAARGEMTCVTMGADASELRIVHILPGAADSESVLRLDGSRQPIAPEGCSGWESARPSRDGERIHVSAEFTCGSAPTQRRSSVLSLTPSGLWLHVEGTGIATIANAQLRALRPVASILRIPSELRPSLEPVLAEAEAAREALRHARPRAADLVELEEEGVAVAVIDVLVAASNPESFVVGVGGTEISAIDDERLESGRLLTPIPAYHGFGYPGFYYNDLAFLYGCSSAGFYPTWSMDPRFCSAYSYYGYRYWDGYRGGYWPGLYPGGTVVIRPREPASAGGRVVRGQGYTPASGSTSGTRSAQPRSSGTGSASAGSSAGSRGSSSSAASGSNSSGSTRTAKPRSP